MTSQANFQKLYRALNPAQKQAVDTIEGPVMVVAGPGTGKTQILTLRIANILRLTDTEPDSILALTFTKSGVLSMRKRLVEMIGTAGYRVNINTFHGFCNEIIKNYPEEFPRIVGSVNVSKVDQIKIMEEIIVGVKLKFLKPYGDPFYYLEAIISQIEHLKRENISPADLVKLLAKQVLVEQTEEKTRAKNKELALVYKKYEEILRAKKLYDYGDMIMEVVKMLAANVDLLRQLQENYQYILADEHQDANQAQNKLLELLASFHDNPNLFIVGDDKQAIFQFQGASLDNFAYFKKLYPEAKIIKLDQNYRSTQTILDSAHSLIGKSKSVSDTAKIALRSRAPARDETPIILRRFSRQELELKFLAEDIKAKQTAGVKLADVAVLYRDNADAWPVVRALERAELPLALMSDENILGDDEVRKLIMILQAVHYFGHDEYFLKVLHIDFFGIDSLTIYKTIAQARDLKTSVFEVVKNSKDKKLRRLYNYLDKWHKDSKVKNATSLFEEVINESGLVDYLLSRVQTVGKVEKLRAIFDEIKEYTFAKHDYTLADFIDYLAMVEKYHLPLNHQSEKGLLGVDGVRLMTTHRSKGLEFDYVYIVGAYDGHFGNKRARRHFSLPLRGELLASEDAKNNNDDERRLFYVALTRAKKAVAISYARLKEGGGENLPSQFVAEIDKKFIAEDDVSTWEAAAETPTKETFKQTKAHDVPLNQKAFLNTLFLHQGLSVSALNNYLTCPWEYFFSNLVRVPQAQNKHQMYGTAVHNALKDFFDLHKEGEKISKKILLDLFTKYLKEQPLDKLDFVESLAKGKRALGGWYEAYKNTWSKEVMTEFAIRGIKLSDKVTINGKLDKIELLSGGRVQVIDYKTGKSKTRNEIEGKTKNSNGDYKRQLVFYKLLLDNYPTSLKLRGTHVYDMRTGVIDFIEPVDPPATTQAGRAGKGRYKREVFEISDTDVKTLREQIDQVANEILNLSFWNKKCPNRACEFCRLRRLMG